MTPFFPPDQIYSDDVYKRGKKLYVALATTIFNGKNLKTKFNKIIRFFHRKIVSSSMESTQDKMLVWAIQIMGNLPLKWSVAN